MIMHASNVTGRGQGHASCMTHSLEDPHSVSESEVIEIQTQSESVFNSTSQFHAVTQENNMRNYFHGMWTERL